MLIDERGKLLLIYDDLGKVNTITKDAYNELKYKSFGGNRIFYTFKKDFEIAETYDARIFNCTYDSNTIQIRDGNAIADSITAHKKTGDIHPYVKLFKAIYYKKHKDDLIKSFVSSIAETEGRVEILSDGGIIVDNMFMVDEHGTSYYRNPENQHGVNAWHHLCTVVQGELRTMFIDSPIGQVEIDATTITIIGKVLFLMNPNLKDAVFMNQLPASYRRTLRQRAKDAEN